MWFKLVPFTILICILNAIAKAKPNIVLIIADDMGWNDVSFHGSNQIPTPNIDALAYNGHILNRFYVQPFCTPSRAALLTGKYPTRYGFQGFPIKAGENRHLPLHLQTLPQQLKKLGYNTTLVGKWHLGFSRRNQTPTYRGFDYHLGYYNGVVNYFDYFNSEHYSGFDMHENLQPAWHLQNEYATHLFTRKAKDVITEHNYEKPLFLVLSHLAVHAAFKGKNLEVPDIEENDKTFHYIADEGRRFYAGMVKELDKSLGIIVKALRDKDVLDDTVIVFLSDNGADNVGRYKNSGSNWPLRGMKATVFEGGIRSPALVYYSKLKDKFSINNNLMHITDLMPTLYAAAGGNVEDLGQIDGINQWKAMNKEEKSVRSSALLEIDEVALHSAIVGYNGQYKLINVSVLVNNAADGYHGHDTSWESNPPYDIKSILSSLTNTAINGGLTEDKIVNLRKALTINCKHVDTKLNRCDSNNLCLFDLANDPCETINLTKKYPDIVKKLSDELGSYWGDLQDQSDHLRDPTSNPVYYNNTWTWWMEI